MRILIGGASLLLVIVAVFLTSLVFAGPHPPDRVSIVVNEQARTVDVSIDGKPFTSYIWPTTLKNPFFTRCVPPKEPSSLAASLSSSVLANASITRITLVFGSTTRASTASIFGTTPKPSNPKMLQRWAPSSTDPSCPQKAARNRANSASKPRG